MKCEIARTKRVRFGRSDRTRTLRRLPVMAEIRRGNRRTRLQGGCGRAVAKEHKKSRNLGLWIPQGIVNMRMLTGDEKLLYAYVYSFGERGCWQTDEQIAKALGRSDRTIRRYLANCKKAGLFKVSGARSKYRRMWAEANPKFK